MRTALYQLSDILDVILLLARGNNSLGEAELRFSKTRKRQNLLKERQRRKDRIESSLFIFDELLGATYPSKMFIGNENAYVCIWLVNQSKWPIKCQSLSFTNQSLVKCNFIYPGRVRIGTFGRSLLLSCSLNGNSSLREKRPVIPLTSLTCIQKQ